MKISQTAVAAAVLLSYAADVPGVSAKRTKVKNLFKKKNGAESQKEDLLHDIAFLKQAMSEEDEQYWDRILQISASVPGAPTPGVPTAPQTTEPTAPVPPPSTPTPAPTPEGFATCVDSGGEVENAMCCQGVGDFPNTCDVGACGCSPFDSEMVLVCLCPDGQCFDGDSCVDDAGATTTEPSPAVVTTPEPSPAEVTTPEPSPEVVTTPAPTPEVVTEPPVEETTEPTDAPDETDPPTVTPVTPVPPTVATPTVGTPTVGTPTVGTPAETSFSFVRRKRRQRRVRKRNSNDE